MKHKILTETKNIGWKEPIRMSVAYKKNKNCKSKDKKHTNAVLQFFWQKFKIAIKMKVINVRNVLPIPKNHYHSAQHNFLK